MSNYNASDVLIGVEFEADVRDSRGHSVPPDLLDQTFPKVFAPAARCACNTDWSYCGCEPSYSTFRHNRRWEVIDEHTGCEFLYRKPRPYKRFLHDVRCLFDAFEQIHAAGGTVVVNDECGMHVHINTTQSIGPHVEANGLVQAYFADNRAIQSSWWNLIKDPLNRPEDYEYATRTTAPGELMRGSKSQDITFNDVGSVEIRTWDATLDFNLMIERYKVIGQLIKKGMQ